jgi:hypothetical protein
MFASQHGRCHKINKGVLFEFQVRTYRPLWRLSARLLATLFSLRAISQPVIPFLRKTSYCTDWVGKVQVSPGLATQVLTRNVGARVNHTTNASQVHRPVRGYLSPPVGGNGLQNPLQLFYESGCINQCSLETFVVLSLDKTGTGEKNYKSLGQA